MRDLLFIYRTAGFIGALDYVTHRIPYFPDRLQRRICGTLDKKLDGE